ncbi:MAG: hypothetical protein AAGF15_05385 [Pseudomonadota bacterium]
MARKRNHRLQGGKPRANDAMSVRIPNSLRALGPFVLVGLGGCAWIGGKEIPLEPVAMEVEEAAPEEPTPPPKRSFLARLVKPTPKVEPIANPSPKPELEDFRGELVGRSTREVANFFGPPDEAIADGANFLWRYRTGECDVEVQFFPDLETNGHYALQYEVTGTEDAQCFARLARRRPVIDADDTENETRELVEIDNRLNPDDLDDGEMEEQAIVQEQGVLPPPGTKQNTEEEPEGFADVDGDILDDAQTLPALEPIQNAVGAAGLRPEPNQNQETDGRQTADGTQPPM